MGIVKNNFSPKVAIFRERVKLYELRQNSNETINDCYIRVKKGAMSCCFGK